MEENFDFDFEDNAEESLFEEEMKKQLLVEALQQQKAEVFENVVFEGTKRYYIEDLSERDYLLENTTPYQIQICGQSIEEKTWVNMICKVLEVLVAQNPSMKQELYNFRCPWSKAVMISAESKTNFKKLEPDLYVNCNHTALHSCWFIQDLLDFFNIDKKSVYFLIHRPSGAEPKEVKEYIEKRFKRQFTYFLQDKYKKDEEYANKVLNNIDKHLNRILKSFSKSHVNFFLFDDKSVLYNYLNTVRTMVNDSLKYDAKAKKVLNKYLDYILVFYRRKS